MKKIDLKFAVIVGDQFDLANTAYERFGGDAEIGGSLRGAGAGVVAEPGEEGGDAVGIAEELEVLGPEFEVVEVDGGFTPGGGFGVELSAMGGGKTRLERGILLEDFHRKITKG